MNTVFPHNVLTNPQQAATRVILAGLNAQVEQLNNMIIKQLPGTLTHARFIHARYTHTSDNVYVSTHAQLTTYVQVKHSGRHP